MLFLQFTLLGTNLKFPDLGQLTSTRSSFCTEYVKEYVILATEEG